MGFRESIFAYLFQKYRVWKTEEEEWITITQEVCLHIKGKPQALTYENNDFVTAGEDERSAAYRQYA